MKGDGRFRHQVRSMALWLALALLISILLVPLLSSAGVTTPRCDAFTDNPHVSDGLGVVVKSRVYCYNNIKTVNIDTILFLCPRPPTGPENSWTSQGCKQRAWGFRFVNNPVNGQEYVNQAPMKGMPAVHGSGWWIGCTIVAWTDSNNKQGAVMVPGNAVDLTA